jgi:hypothetical protein
MNTVQVPFNRLGVRDISAISLALLGLAHSREVLASPCEAKTSLPLTAS